MTDHLLTPVLELRIPGLQSEFSLYHLEQRARSLMEDLRSLLDSKKILKHTVMSHTFRLITTENGGLMLVVGLAFSNQFSLNFRFEPVELGMVDEMVLHDRQAIVSACRNLPTTCDLAAVEWAQVYSSACLNLPEEDVHTDLSRRINMLLGVKHRKLEGEVADQPWQHSLEGLGKYKWSNEVIQIRAQLNREKRGYSLRLLNAGNLPYQLQSVRTLRMLDRPHDVEAASFLDRSEHVRSAVEMMIRVGSRPDSDQPVVADFVSLC